MKPNQTKQDNMKKPTNSIDKEIDAISKPVYSSVELARILSDALHLQKKKIITHLIQAIGEMKGITFKESLIWSDKHKQLEGDGARVVHIKHLLTRALSDVQKLIEEEL